MPRPPLLLAACCLVFLGGLTSSFLAQTPRAATPQAAEATATGATTTSAAAAVVVFNGHGWGHGLGLSQWGAYGYAKHAWTFDRILAHYYTGTTLGAAEVSTVRVLLATGKSAVLQSQSPWTVTDAAGTRAVLEPGRLVLTTKLRVPDHPKLEPPYTFASAQPLVVAGAAYPGRLSVSSDGKVVQVVDRLGLETYLKGVVPAEMPSSWPPEALKAQAVAARSYALANLTKGRAFDLYGDTRDQVYGGAKVANAATDAAVDATKGEVVLYNGKVADTLFFSTSGGRTASAAESLGVPVPYLVPVADPYDTASPYHDWGPVLLDAATVARRVGVASPIADMQRVTGASGRVASLTFVLDDESQVTVTGNKVRTALDLRSTWFTSALLTLAAATKTMTFGGAVSLSGTVHGADSVSLEAKPFGGDWAPAGQLLVGPDGSFSTIVHPQISTQYRLAWGNVRAGLAAIAVAVRVDAAITKGGATGATKPAVANSAVQLQWSSKGAAGWKTVASATTDAAGAFSLAGTAPEAGVYRVRVAPGHGLAPGLSNAVPCC
ncbi:MAG: SpoIID/LytB domain-containing protein [Gaiellaceae bacterium]